jgi:hypothetical protein
MAEILVFTLLATIAAVYPILPEYRQLRIRYNLWTLPRLGFFVLMFVVILLTYALSIFVQSGDRNVFDLNIFDWSATISLLHIELVQLGAVLCIVGPLAVVFVKSNVRIRNEANLMEILRDLYNREEYTALVNLIDDSYIPLVNHPTKPTRPNSLAEIFKQDLREDLDDDLQEGFGEFYPEIDETEDGTEDEDGPPAESKTLVEPLISGFQASREKAVREKKEFEFKYRRLNYWLSNTAEDASELTESILLDPDFVKLYAGVASELGLRILQDDTLGNPRRDVVHRYLRTQLRTENSLLHRNLRENTQKDGLYRYDIQEENRLLYALLSDFDRAEELDIYQPIGREARNLIQEQRREDLDVYNDRRLNNTQTSDDYTLYDPLFLAIHFFDVMAREAFYQEVDWHVWISYYESFTQEICKNYKITEYSDREAEFPNDYSRLLYEINRNLLDWIEMMAEEADPDAVPNEVGEHMRLDSTNSHRGGRNIPEMAAFVVFSCHEEILTTDEIPSHFNGSLTESLFLQIVELRNYGEESIQWKYNELMLNCLRENIEGRRADPDYQRELSKIYNGEYGVRSEVLTKDTEMTGVTDELDNIINP